MFLLDFLHCPVDYPAFLRAQEIAECEAVITGQSRISVSEHLPSALEPALSYTSLGDVR